MLFSRTKMKMSVLHIRLLLLAVVTLPLVQGQGNVANVEIERGGPKNCRKPNAKDGTVLSKAKGCIKQTCLNGFWKSSMNDDVCCFKQIAYQPNTTIDKILADDGCTEMTVHCSQYGGAASLVFKNKNSCPKPATETQVDNQTKVLDTKMEMLEKKIESEIAKLKYSLEEKMENLTLSMEKCMAKKEVYGVVLRLPTHGAIWNVQKGKIDAIDFVSTSSIKIRGISLFGSHSGSATHSGLIQLKETLFQTIMAETFEYTSNGDPVFYDTLFSSQYEVKMGVKYTITVEYYNTAREQIWYGEGGQASTVALCNGDTITIEFSKPAESTNGSGVSSGQIPRILFSC